LALKAQKVFQIPLGKRISDLGATYRKDVKASAV